MVMCVPRPMRSYHVLTTTNQIALRSNHVLTASVLFYCATRCAFFIRFGSFHVQKLPGLQL